MDGVPELPLAGGVRSSWLGEEHMYELLWNSIAFEEA